MAAAIKKPSREKEEAGAGNMMLDVHPLHPSRPFPNRKPNRENRIKSACNSNSHSNIAPSNDKRPVFVQIPATPSASLVSTSLPIQCLRPTNFFFYRGIFLNSFLREQDVAGVRARCNWRASKMKLVCEQEEAGVRARRSWCASKKKLVREQEVAGA